MIPHVIRPGQFREGQTGPAVLMENIEIVMSDRRSHKIEENTTVEGEQAIGLYVTDPGVKVGPDSTQIPAANFATAYLTLRDRERVIIERLYLSTIKKWNDQAKPFPLHLASKIQFSRSELIIENHDGLTEDMRCMFQVEYLSVRS